MAASRKSTDETSTIPASSGGSHEKSPEVDAEANSIFRKPSLSRLEARFSGQAKQLWESTKSGRKYGEWRVLLEKLDVTYRQIVEATAPNTPDSPDDLQLDNLAAQGEEGGW